MLENLIKGLSKILLLNLNYIKNLYQHLKNTHLKFKFR